MDSYLELLDGLVESRNIFFSRTINLVPVASRGPAYSRFMTNELCYLDILNRIFARGNTNQIVLNIPSNFGDNVVVAPSADQIAQSLENVAGPQGACAVCQDAISSDGVRIRQCSHAYHGSCIRDWFTMSVRCPVCRYDIREPTPAPPS
jgi:hypothetical protein